MSVPCDAYNERERVEGRESGGRKMGIYVEREIGGREMGIYVERGRSEREGRFTGQLLLIHSNMYVSVATHGQLTIEKIKAICLK
mgnify:CR=1 FL=1